MAVGISEKPVRRTVLETTAFMFQTVTLRRLTETPDCVIYTGYQPENRCSITVYAYDDGKKRALVTHGASVICEFDIP